LKNRPVKRREFLVKTSLTAIASALSIPVVFSRNIPKGMELVGMPSADDILPGKDPNLTILNSRPWNVEAPAHLLNDDVTPADKFFVRNNGIPPTTIDVDSWTLEISGESAKQTKSFSIAELRQKFKTYSYHLTLECGGNGRAGFYPSASGNQWTEGAVACAKWTGVRLKDILEDVGIKDDAVYIGYYGKDTHLSGDANKVVISRGVPMSKALEDETLVAWAMNDEDIPFMNGHPLRLVIGGWPASTSGKWLDKIVIRNIVHDGPKMEGNSYRVPKNPVQPGEEVPLEDFKIIESMPVKSLITYPKTGANLSTNKKLKVNGQAWAGDLEVTAMQVSIDFGATWQPCELTKPVNRLAWQHWSAEVEFPQSGYYEIWAKATDSEGKSQPMVIPGWNPKGYLNNSCHRIAVRIK
jgi:DMSO/TMAO reductase YedYZ molybdopterin-dependent catalytic subunit